ncbi:Homocysteine S-methyltransferase [Dactylonectria estremocensis]|uniref:Homocysteine S-methyltransferase n=1 Tax=Dactylonectria estremocensis TaxID=1079267 RepID=A0A9P9DVS7_9HYPO|nr:Homocysteine S-methyltransferase [Dactylonectria estremocensis]
MPSQILILDGGLGTSLEAKYGVTFSRATPLWSSDLLVSDPATLLACQKDFGDVPVDILLTATYQVSLHGFAGTRSDRFPDGIGAESVPPFLDDAVAIAQKAVGAHEASSSRVALSCGPYGACMIPGQEYSGKYDTAHDSPAALEAWHRERMQLFGGIADVGTRVGYVALETIPRLDEIVAMRRAVASTPTLSGLPFWTAILSPGDAMTLPDGSSIEAAVEAMLDPALSASVPWGIGINCTKVHKLDGLLRVFESAVARMVDDGRAKSWPALILYPDGTNGEVYNTTTQKWELPEGAKPQDRGPWEVQVAEAVRATEERGQWPTIVVGGCCRATNDDIAKLKGHLLG